jgi:hypothetical protein
LWAVVRRKDSETTVQRWRVELTEERPMKCDKYMGLDVHQAMTVVVVLDADGRVILETMVPTENGSDYPISAEPEWTAAGHI